VPIASPATQAEQLFAERRQPGGLGMVLLPLARVAGEGVALRVVELAPEPDARIGEACARLSGTAQPIRHIAASVGYASRRVSTASSCACVE
jgi:hypothetical protein